MQPFGLIPVLEDDDLTLFGMLSFFLFQLLHFFTLHHHARFHIYYQTNTTREKNINFT